MTGALAQLIGLVSYGNDFLNGEIISPNFYPKNLVFQFCSSVKYVTFKKSVFTSKVNEIAVANDPIEWLELIKNEGSKKLALYFQNSEDQSEILDHQAAGFANGGGSWIIEVVYKNHSDFWLNNWAVTDAEAKDNKIWSVKYGLTSQQQPLINLQYQLFEVRDELNNILAAIADFAFKNNFPSWGQVFEKANRNLESLTPKQILFSAGSAWVFGGMGSWNDIGFEKEETNKLYDELSAKLYDCINKSVIAVLNTEPSIA